MALDKETINRLVESERKFNARYDALNVAYTRILQEEGIQHYLGTLEEFLKPEELQALRAISGDTRGLLDALWKRKVDMSEDE